MEKNYEVRYAARPADVKSMDTEALRKEFLVENIMQKNQVNIVYSHYDRMIVGGAVPAGKALKLEAIEPQKAKYFLERRELGIINVGQKGTVKADGVAYELEYKDALYIGKGVEEVIFESAEAEKPAHFYLNSALAHVKLPNKKVARAEANPVYLGSQENSNERVLNQYIVPGIVETAQLMMGVTEVKSGNVWNTMPCHLHELRMEAYFYFEVPDDQAVCHFMGRPQETRHLWLADEQLVLSPPWSLHAAAGTTNYCFIWGMAGSDSEMDGIAIKDLR